MATCKDCLHVEVCGWSYLPPTAEQCVDFKDKAKYVVREKGEWKQKKHKIFGNSYDYVCTVCGCDYALAEYNFCPNCGADMRKGEDDGT